VEEEDIAWAFSGGCAPLFLRPDGEDHYTFIGDCFIHGIMNGEVMLREDLSEQTMKIR
jgi:hypothetical protein